MFVAPDECAEVVTENHAASESLKGFEVEGVKVDVDIGWMITHESINVVLVSFIVLLQRWMIGDILHQNIFLADDLRRSESQ